MKNSIVILFALCFCLFSQQALSQNVTREEVEFKKGDIEVSAGVGLLSTFRSKNATTRVLPLNFTVAYRLNQNVSLGAYMAYSSTGWEPEQVADEVPEEYLINRFYMTGLRAEGHFNRDRVDFYGGAMIAYNFSQIETNIDPDDPQPEGVEINEDDNAVWTYSGYVGVKYMMTKHLGLFGEIGHGASIISFGLTTKF